VLASIARVVAACKAHDVVVGHPHVEVANAERLIGEGFRFLMCAPARSYAALDKAREVAGRK
jgi:4-hydroxy-2-oxoheptanedioate aldolase